MTLPLHERIRSEIEGQILSGALSPGDRIPIEHELMHIYGCARMTVHKAISALAAAGLVERRKRLGTIIAQPRVHSMILDVPDLPTEVRARGRAYGWKLTARRVRQPRRGAAAEKALAKDNKLLEIRGIHYADGEPLAVEHRLISLLAAPGIRDAPLIDQPPGTWLLQNVPWTDAATRISAIAADADIARGLAVSEATSCLSIERETWRGTDQITHVWQVFLGERYDLYARFNQQAIGERKSV